MYQIGQRVVTDVGIGDILKLEHGKYCVLLNFPFSNAQPYGTWITDDNIRYLLDIRSDYKRILSEDDKRVTRSVNTHKERKPKSVWRYGRYTQVWR
jgi:hypothetical protein